jgi:drug/metabolite transporter (DMT)-like permease
MILLLSGENIHYIDFLYLFVIIIGIFLLFFSHFPEEEKKEAEPKVENKPICGFIMILFAAFTEACIYFIVRRMKTNNNWNHLFLSYFFGAIFLTGYYLCVTSSLNMEKSIQSNISTPLFISVIINFVIGLFGYLLRFYSITRLPTKIYALLSYVGIVMAYVYGVLFNQEQININKIAGSICIIIPVYWLSIANR